MTRGASALVLSGGPGYSDPWHRFEQTSEAIAGVLEGAGHRVEVSTAVGPRLADVSGVDLLVVNAPLPEEPLGAAALAAASGGLQAFLARGGAVLAVHVGVTTLLGLPEWSPLIGARWVPEQSGHPPLGRAVLSRRPDPRTGPAARFDLVDERYTGLEVTGQDLVVVVDHDHEGRAHPLVWTREVRGARIVADALGHGPESFGVPEHREILTRLVAWALEPGDGNVSVDPRELDKPERTRLA